MAAFGQLMSRHQQTVFRVVRRYAPVRDESMDLVQRTFLQAFASAEGAFRSMLRQSSDGVPFKAWVLRIAMNLAKNHVRDTKRRPGAALELVDREQDSGDQLQHAVERAEEEALVREAVGQLSERQAEIFSLRIDAGLSFAEVAEALHITETNAKTQFHQAAKRLRELVQSKL